MAEQTKDITEIPVLDLEAKLSMFEGEELDIQVKEKQKWLKGIRRTIAEYARTRKTESDKTVMLTADRSKVKVCFSEYYEVPEKERTGYPSGEYLAFKDKVKKNEVPGVSVKVRYTIDARYEDIIELLFKDQEFYLGGIEREDKYTFTPSEMTEDTDKQKVYIKKHVVPKVTFKKSKDRRQ